MGAPAAKRFEIRRRCVCGAVRTLSRSLGTSGQAVACACHAVVSHSVRAAGGRSVDRPAAALSPEDGVAHHLPPLCASPLLRSSPPDCTRLPRALPPIRRESVAQAQRCVAKVTYSEPINKALGTSLLIPQVGRSRRGYPSIMHTTIPCSSRIESHRGPPRATSAAGTGPLRSCVAAGEPLEPPRRAHGARRASHAAQDLVEAVRLLLLGTACGWLVAVARSRLPLRYESALCRSRIVCASSDMCPAPPTGCHPMRSFRSGMSATNSRSR